MLAYQSEQNVTKSSLETLHRNCVRDIGSLSSQKQKEIINSFGGFDEMLYKIWVSDIVLRQQQLNSLHHIMSSTQADANNDQTITFAFKDEDILLFDKHISSKETALKIMRILKSNITKAILVLILLLGVAMGIISLYVHPSYGPYLLNSFTVVMYSSFALYLVGWILCVNKEAIKILSTQFEFWFKLFYLILFTSAHISWQIFVDDLVLEADGLFTAVFLCLVMMFDALNISQTHKIMLSSIAFALFFWGTLDAQKLIFYDADAYQQATVHIPDHFGFGSMRINLLDIIANSGQILAIFFFKQMVFSIARPDKAAVIKVVPDLVYTDRIIRAPTSRTVKYWQCISCSYWIFWIIVILMGVSESANVTFEHILYVGCMIMIVSSLIAGCMSIKFVYFGIGMILLTIFLAFFSALLFDSDGAPFIGFICVFGLGLTSSYLLKQEKYENREDKQREIQKDFQSESSSTHNGELGTYTSSRNISPLLKLQ